MSKTKGRKNDERPFTNTIGDKSAEQAMLEKMDEMIDAMKAMTAKMDADAGITDTDYASTITDGMEKVDLE